MSGSVNAEADLENHSISKLLRKTELIRKDMEFAYRTNMIKPSRVTLKLT